MKQYKCPHSHLGNTDPTQPLTYTLMGTERLPVDPEGQIFWHMYDFSDDLEKHHQIGSFANAFGKWERWLYPWKFVATSDPKKAVWKIRVAKDNKVFYEGKWIPSPYNFDQNPDTIAVQWAYLKGYQWSLTMVVNDRFLFDIVAGDQKIWFECMLTHEIGHGLNIGHTQKKHKNNNEIMGDEYNEHGVITSDSANALWDYHGDHLREDSKRLPMAIRYNQEMKKIQPSPMKAKKDFPYGLVFGIVMILLFGFLILQLIIQ